MVRVKDLDKVKHAQGITTERVLEALRGHYKVSATQDAVSMCLKEKYNSIIGAGNVTQSL